jgi:hypothetical protein
MEDTEQEIHPNNEENKLPSRQLTNSTVLPPLLKPAVAVQSLAEESLVHFKQNKNHYYRQTLIETPEELKCLSGFC